MSLQASFNAGVERIRLLRHGAAAALVFENFNSTSQAYDGLVTVTRYWGAERVRDVETQIDEMHFVVCQQAGLTMDAVIAALSPSVIHGGTRYSVKAIDPPNGTPGYWLIKGLIPDLNRE